MPKNFITTIFRVARSRVVNGRPARFASANAEQRALPSALSRRLINFTSSIATV
ncbi:MAG: hypothetical protein HOO96_32270 [Polyangiaceae bacterium]|nr:hypothetical protein [Polyangiaceae bacterium]